MIHLAIGLWLLAFGIANIRVIKSSKFIIHHAIISSYNQIINLCRVKFEISP